MQYLRIFFGITLFLILPIICSAENEAENLSLGIPIQLPEIGQPYIAEQFDSWALRCLRTNDPSDPCEMYQLMLNEQNQPMSEISIFRLPKDSVVAAGANVIVPLETLLTEPLTIKYNKDKIKQYPFTFCNKVGCIARIGFSNEEVELMKMGKSVQVTVFHISDTVNPITFSMSLKGFTAAYNNTTIMK
tara:strand:+ start:272 stop:838 length:567 start_codon:yes stop_codon:yes gene_type:complete